MSIQHIHFRTMIYKPPPKYRWRWPANGAMPNHPNHPLWVSWRNPPVAPLSHPHCEAGNCARSRGRPCSRRAGTKRDATSHGQSTAELEMRTGKGLSLTNNSRGKPTIMRNTCQPSSTMSNNQHNQWLLGGRPTITKQFQDFQM